MNFLAHLLLSGDDPDLLIGNFIADSVRSSQHKNYSVGVVAGIKLHHEIDFFTDHHALVEKSKKRLRGRHGKYSSVIVDIFYDHFLAADFHHYSQVKLEQFARNCHSLFRDRWDELPLVVQNMLPFMERGNWLVNYREKEGLESVFMGMSRRAKFENKMDKAPEDLFNDYDEYQKEFREFFPRLQDYTKEKLKMIRYDN